MVFGIRCTKESLHITILDGTVESPVYNEARIKITIKTPKAIKSRGGALADMMKEFKELLEKYQPSKVCIKKSENSRHKIPIQSLIQKGEVEGMILISCFDAEVVVEELLYSQLKVRVKAASQKKSDLHGLVEQKFSDVKMNNEVKDAVLSAWAVLDE